MEIINGVEVAEGVFINDPTIQYHSVTKVDNYTVLPGDTGKTLIMNSSSDKTFTLFTPTAADIGKRFTFANINTGKLTVAVAGTGVILNGGTSGTGTMYSDDNNVSSLTIELTSATKWTVISATGTWTTT